MAPATSRFGVRVVIENGLDVSPFAVAVILTSPTLELNAVPELSTLIEEPVKDETVILLAPAVMFHVVEEPPLEVSWIEVAYPETVKLLKYQTVLGPLIAGMTLAVPLGVKPWVGHIRWTLLLWSTPKVCEVVEPTATPLWVP